MLPYRDSRITRAVLIIFFLFILGYAYFEARGILFGPHITVTSDIQSVTEPYVEIQGRADRISSLTMNGNPVAVTESGEFKEPFLLSPGVNRIILQAADTYGSTAEQVVTIVYNPPETPVTPEPAPATTTPATPPPATTTPEGQM